MDITVTAFPRQINMSMVANTNLKKQFYQIFRYQVVSVQLKLKTALSVCSRS